MSFSVAVEVYEERPLLTVELAEKAAAAVRDFLASLPHAEAVQRDYQRFIAEQPDALSGDAYHAVLKWQMIEKQAKAVAARAIGIEPNTGQRIAVEIALPL